MSWTTNYSGPQIDETLEKGRDLKIVNNGWYKLDASESSPTNLGNLKNPGNYVTFYWIDGPTLEKQISHLKISVILINDKIHQFVNALEYTFSRIIDDDNKSNWSIDQTYGTLKPGASAPSTNLVDGKTLWLDTTNVNIPILKLYIDGIWKEVIPASVMQRMIYDPQGKKTDIFNYIETSISKLLNESESIDFEDHINATDIHVTAAEKAKWDSSPTTESLRKNIDEIKSDIDNNINEGYRNDISKFEDLDDSITETNTIYEHHVKNTTIHPDTTKRTEWNNKADGYHTHSQDGKVTIDPAHVAGIVPLDKLSYSVKERVYFVRSIEAMYAYPLNPIHNGDMFCIETGTEDNWYIVINDQAIGTENAYRLINAQSAIEWSRITNTPTTISGYGIINAATQNDASGIYDRASELKEEYSDEDKANIDTIVATETIRNEAYSMLSQGNPFSLLDLAVASLESITE